jgi:uncharacterized protein
MAEFGPSSDNPLAAPFWHAASEDRLVLPFDRSTGAPSWYPRADQASVLEWREVAGAARLIAWTVVRAPINPDFAVPYAPALVELDAAPGIRLVTQIVDCDFAQLRCDMPLVLCFRDLKAGDRPVFRAPVFQPLL